MAKRRASMNWAKRLRRVFNIDIDICSECAGAMKVIASIEDPEVVRKILAHLNQNAGADQPESLAPRRAPPGDLIG